MQERDFTADAIDRYVDVSDKGTVRLVVMDDPDGPSCKGMDEKKNRLVTTAIQFCRSVSAT